MFGISFRAPRKTSAYNNLCTLVHLVFTSLRCTLSFFFFSFCIHFLPCRVSLIWNRFSSKTSPRAHTTPRYRFAAGWATAFKLPSARWQLSLPRSHLESLFFRHQTRFMRNETVKSATAKKSLRIMIFVPEHTNTGITDHFGRIRKYKTRRSRAGRPDVTTRWSVFPLWSVFLPE